MRFIPRLPPVAVTQITGEPVLRPDGTPAEFTQRQFLLGRTTDPAFGSDMEAVMAAIRIRDAVDSDKPFIEVESADYDRLDKATRTPQAGYVMAVAHCLEPFIRGVIDAKTKPPLKSAELPAAE